MVVTAIAASVSPFVRAVTSINGTWDGVAVAAFVIERATFSVYEVPAFGAEGAISFMSLSSCGCFYVLLSPVYLFRQGPELRQEGNMLVVGFAAGHYSAVLPVADDALVQLFCVELGAV